MRFLCVALIAALLISTPAAGDDSFCGQWGSSWKESEKSFLMEKLVESHVDRGMRGVPGLVACVKRNMQIQKPAISKMCGAASQPDFTTGLFIGQVISWITMKCGNDSNFKSQPRF